jgi:hypothetical protein
MFEVGFRNKVIDIFLSLGWDDDMLSKGLKQVGLFGEKIEPYNPRERKPPTVKQAELFKK